MFCIIKLELILKKLLTILLFHAILGFREGHFSVPLIIINSIHIRKVVKNMKTLIVGLSWATDRYFNFAALKEDALLECVDEISISLKKMDEALRKLDSLWSSRPYESTIADIEQKTCTIVDENMSLVRIGVRLPNNMPFDFDISPNYNRFDECNSPVEYAPTITNLFNIQIPLIEDTTCETPKTIIYVFVGKRDVDQKREMAQKNKRDNIHAQVNHNKMFCMNFSTSFAPKMKLRC